MKAVRDKSVDLTTYAIDLADALLAAARRHRRVAPGTGSARWSRHRQPPPDARGHHRAVGPARAAGLPRPGRAADRAVPAVDQLRRGAPRHAGGPRGGAAEDDPWTSGVSFITLAVADLDATRRSTSAAWAGRPSRRARRGADDQGRRQVLVASGPRPVRGRGRRSAGRGLAPFTLAHNVATRDEVDTVLATARGRRGSRCTRPWTASGAATPATSPTRTATAGRSPGRPAPSARPCCPESRTLPTPVVVGPSCSLSARSCWACSCHFLVPAATHPRPRPLGTTPTTSRRTSPPVTASTRCTRTCCDPKGIAPDKRTPVILTVSPYTNHSGEPLENGFDNDGPSDRFYDFLDLGRVLERGYTYVMVDLPGFGGSSGCNDWGGNREQDAVEAAVKWAAAPSAWSTGKVGMIGKSYDASTRLMGVAQRPAGLEAVVAMEPVYAGYNYLYNRGVRFTNSVLTPALFQAIDATPGSVNDSPSARRTGRHRRGATGSTSRCSRSTRRTTRSGRSGTSCRRDEGPVAGAAVPNQGFLETNTKQDAAFRLLQPAGVAGQPRVVRPVRPRAQAGRRPPTANARRRAGRPRSSSGRSSTSLPIT